MRGWNLRAIVQRVKALLGSAGSDDEQMDVDDIDNLRAWSISCQLAAVPRSYEEAVPPEIAALIRAARDLHPEMARGARERDARGEPCPILG